MNKNAFLAVADVIEYADRFDLRYYTHYAKDPCITPSETMLWEDCNTVGCVSGWTNAWADSNGDTEDSEFILGITESEGRWLFFNGPRSIWRRVARDYGWKFDVTYSDFSTTGDEQITAAQAADVLRRIAREEIFLTSPVVF